MVVQPRRSDKVRPVKTIMEFVSNSRKQIYHKAKESDIPRNAAQKTY